MYIYISSLVLHKPTESTAGCKVFIAKNGYQKGNPPRPFSGRKCLQPLARSRPKRYSAFPTG